MKKLVIIGGGFAGSLIAKKLEKHFGVTLIDTKNYFEFTPGVLRTIVDPSHVRKMQILHTHYLHRTKIVVGEVTEVTNRFAKVKNKKIPFDYLVVASGSKYSAPFKEQNIIHTFRAKNLRASYDKLCAAKNIVIVGGGLVGVELAAEICTHYSDKNITLVHAHERLIERNLSKASSYAKNFLQKKGVQIIFNEKMVKVKGKKCKTSSGKVFPSDLTFICTGIIPNFSFMKKNLFNSLNEKGFIKANDSLQVENHENIFAVGDIAGIIEEKTAQNAERQARVVVHNLHALESKAPLQKYVSKKTPLVISLGMWSGIYSQGNLVFTGFLPGIMKGKIEWWKMFKKKYF